MPANEDGAKVRLGNRKMGRWNLILAVAAAMVLPVGVAQSADLDGVGQAYSALHAIGILALIWSLSSLRISRHNGEWRVGFEPSPVRRVRALSTVHRADMRHRRVNKAASAE